MMDERGPKTASLSSSADSALLEAPATKILDVPHVLQLRSPNGQSHSAGLYVLQEAALRGCAVWKHVDNDNRLYPMQNGRWGVASTFEFNGGDSQLAHVYCPEAHGGALPHQMKCTWSYWGGAAWVADKEIKVKVFQHGAPKLSLAQALQLEDELIAEYAKDDFQRRLHEAWAAAGDDGLKQKEARTLMCLPIQLLVIGKYGFERSLKGVQQSVRAFKIFDSSKEVMSRSVNFDWLLNPDIQKEMPKPQIVPALTQEVYERRGSPVSIVARLISGEVLATLTLSHTDTMASVREAVESSVDGDNNQRWRGPLKLLVCGNVVADTDRMTDVGLCDGSEVLVVFLQHFKVLTSSSDLTAKFFDTATGECVQTFHGHTDSVRAAAVSHDGTMVVTASFDRTAKLFDAVTAECKHTFSGHTNHVNSAVFSWDDLTVMTASDDSAIKFYNVSSGECKETLLVGCRVKTAVFSLDGHHVLTSGGGYAAQIFSVSTGVHIQSFPGHRDEVNDALFSSDGSRIVTASDDCTSKVFEVASGACKVTFRGHGKSVNTAIFLPDGSRVLSASKDTTVRLFDVMTGGCLQLFRIQDKCANSALFLPGGLHVLVASDDYAVRLFNVRSGECEQSFDGHVDVVHRMFLGPLS